MNCHHGTIHDQRYARGCAQETQGWPLSVRDRLNAFWRAREPATQPRLNIASPTFSSSSYIYIYISLAGLFLAVYTPVVTFHPGSGRERPRVRRKDKGGGLVHARFIIPFWPGQKIHSPIPRAQRTGVCSRILTIRPKVDWPTPLL